jgi:phosphoribosylformylglycinamidine cyclo-ligase
LPLSDIVSPETYILGDVSDDDMLRTYNLGVGMAVVCHSEQTEGVVEALNRAGEDAYIIGNIVSGSGTVRCNGQIDYAY